MSKVPAWKRLGLKVKEDSAEVPFAATTHFDGSAVTNKVAKKLNKKRQLEEPKNEKTKKPPKRVKVAKAERGPPPEKDQLSYLRQFVKDKENWKFSKQKQNWLLKNIEHIPASYENDLIAYLEDIQGGARTRVETDLRAVIGNWNEYSKKLEEKINAELYGEKTEENGESDEKSEGSEEKKKEEAPKEQAPSREYAVRCQKLLSAMLEEPVHLEGENSEAVASTQEVPEIAESVPEAVSETTTEPAEDEKRQEVEDNLIIDEVEVEEYDQREEGSDDPVTAEKGATFEIQKAEKTETGPVKAEAKKAAKKSKKEKKAKKSKAQQ